MTRESLVVVRRREEFLVLRRCPEDGGYWHVAGGGVEDGESHETAAVRELHEEIGLRATVVDAGYVYTYEDVEGRIFVSEAREGWEPTLNAEHDEYRWCAREEAAALMRWPEAADVIRAL